MRWLRRRQMEELHTMDTAMQWVLKLRDESVTERVIADWLRWYECDERNKKAFDETQELWHLTGQLGAGPGGPERIRRLRSASTLKGPTLIRSRWVMISFAASLAILLTTLTVWRWLFREADEQLTVTTAATIVRGTLLSDGSHMELAAKSSVAVQYTSRQRLLELRTGEAHFLVAPNPNRPFIVKAGDLKVRAIGTAFDVRRAGERVVVTVDKGTVDVYRASYSGEIAPGDSVRVNAGSEVEWDSGAARVVVASVDTGRALAWREGRLEYISEPLSAVIADVNRYATHPVVIRDKAAAELVFTGTVFVNSTEEWLQALPGEFPVDLISSGAGELTLVSRAARKSGAADPSPQHARP